MVIAVPLRGKSKDLCLWLSLSPLGVYSEVNDAARMSHLSRQLNADATYNEPVQRVVAIYDYEAQGKEELTLNDGDIITVLTKEDEVWWYGEIKGRRGMFPKAYVEVVGARV